MIQQLNSRMELFPIQRLPCDNHNLGVGFPNISFFLSKIALEVSFYPPEFLFNTTYKEYLLITERYIKQDTLSISMKANIEDKMVRKRCPFCNKEIASLSKKQLEFNYYSHVGSCKNKKENKEANNDITRA